jgi:hypothetical protein
MARFKSSEEIFQAVRDLLSRLEDHGHPAAVAELKAGFGCLNGLTDGWALFLESIEKVRAADARKFGRDEKRALDELRAAVRFAVHRG